MTKADKFYGLLAVTFLATIAYFSIHTKVVEKVITTVEQEEVPVYVTDTLVVTETDTICEYKTYQDDIVMNGADVVMNKRFLFHLSEDTNLTNEIRDVLPFGDVFNYWRDLLGPCGIFEWNDNLYVTLYKEEEINECVEWSN